MVVFLLELEDCTYPRFYCVEINLNDFTVVPQVKLIK